MRVPNNSFSKIAINIAILLLLGLAVLIGVSGYMSQKYFGNSHSYFLRQAVSLLVGLALGFYALKLPIFFIKKKSLIFIIFCWILMLLVFVPHIGLGSGGAMRWIKLGPQSVQPSELFKLAAIVYAAFFLSEQNYKKITDTLIFIMLLGLFAFPIILQKDLSTLIVLFGALCVMYFMAKTPPTHLVLLIVVLILGLAGLAVVESYRVERIKILFNPDLDPMGTGYHINQALITVGSGKLLGVGLGLSRQKFGFLPQSMTDSIFAIIAEELGFLGALATIALLTWLCFQIFMLGRTTEDRFSQLICFGIGTWIMIQSFINIGSAVGLLPITGLPLPFISYGGSALIAELVACGLLLNIARKKI